MGEGNVFSLFTHGGAPSCPSGRGYFIQPDRGWEAPPSSLTGDTPKKLHGGTFARSVWDTPLWDWMRVPSPSGLDGVTAPPPATRTGWGYPPGRTGWGLPPYTPADRAAERVLATRQAVCLLRSRMKTFLFSKRNKIVRVRNCFRQVKPMSDTACEKHLVLPISI